MANTEQQFKGFLDNIRLTNDDLTPLRTSRDANRERIRKYWRETLKRTVPTFEEQGSFDMGTGVKPLSGDHDIDDGVYLQCIGTDRSTWPSTATLQGWLVNAVSGATHGDPQKRKRCVRVPYKGGYHIDLPAYGTDESGKFRLFEKGKVPSDFVESNPCAFADWFREKNRVQPKTRDVVRFIKAWRNYQGGELKRLKGVAITILVANNLCAYERYDETVANTARACATYLELNRSIFDPVAPWENLTEAWTPSEMDAVIAEFKALADRGDEAIDEDTVRDAALIWKGEFGARFPVPAEEKSGEGALVLRQAPVIGSGSYA